LTAWGTVGCGEENFDSYFNAQGTAAADNRYGLSNEDSANGCENDLDRFDTNAPGYANEANRFGWIVEVDPWDPDSTPVKHTNMGRFEHEGADIPSSDSGRAAG